MKNLFEPGGNRLLYTTQNKKCNFQKYYTAHLPFNLLRLIKFFRIFFIKYSLGINILENGYLFNIETGVFASTNYENENAAANSQMTFCQ